LKRYNARQTQRDALRSGVTRAGWLYTAC